MELPIEFLAGIVRGTGGKRWRQFAPLIFGIFLFVRWLHVFLVTAFALAAFDSWIAGRLEPLDARCGSLSMRAAIERACRSGHHR